MAIYPKLSHRLQSDVSSFYVTDSNSEPLYLANIHIVYFRTLWPNPEDLISNSPTAADFDQWIELRWLVLHLDHMASLLRDYMSTALHICDYFFFIDANLSFWLLKFNLDPFSLLHTCCIIGSISMKSFLLSIISSVNQINLRKNLVKQNYHIKTGIKS